MKTLKCHCGLVEAQINIQSFEKILKCNCSICKRKGAIMSMVKNEDFKIIKGQDKLKLYQFHTKVGFNMGCIDEVDTFKLNNISINDGNNHPLDKKKNG